MNQNQTKKLLCIWNLIICIAGLTSPLCTMIGILTAIAALVMKPCIRSVIDLTLGVLS